MSRTGALAFVVSASLPLVIPAATSAADLPRPGPAAPAATRPAAATEAEARRQLVGVWRGFAVEGKGETPDRGPVKLVLTVTETAMHGVQIKNAEEQDHGTGDFTIDLAADPRTLDASQPGPNAGRRRTYLGIYRLEGDTLRWCVSPQNRRPTTFESGKGQFLLILKRDPAAPPAKP